MTGPTKTEDRRGMKLQQLTFIHRRDREFSRSPEGARTPREQVNFYKQVEQVLTDALRCSDVWNTDFEQVGPPLDAVRLAAGQTLYRLMNNRLGSLQMMWSLNPGSEGLTDHSPGCLMLHHSRAYLSQRIHRAIWCLKTTRAPEMGKL